jgi:hypothetical protein
MQANLSQIALSEVRMFGLRKANRTDEINPIKLAALSAITTNVMIADPNFRIVYMNPPVIDFLKEAEADLQKELPHFKVATLIGAQIDIFHKDPQHQRRLLAGLKKTHKATIKVGQRVFDLTANPLFDESGRRLGTVVEWADAQLRELCANLGDGLIGN